MPEILLQGSQVSLSNGYEIQNNQDAEAGPESLNKTEPKNETLVKSVPPPSGIFGIFGIFNRLFGREKVGNTERNQKGLSLREDALDREATLMNVLKSVTSNKSETDLIEASKETKSGFNFFGMRSKSKENVIESSEEVKKLPTLDDKTIDKNKKFAPMENLTDAGKPKKSGLARLKRIRDEMFGKKHQTLKEEEPKETEAPTEIGEEKTEEEKKEDENKEKEDLDFEEQKVPFINHVDSKYCQQK